MNKKIISILLVIATTAAMLSGCNEVAVEGITKNAEEILDAIEDIQEFTGNITNKGSQEDADESYEEVVENIISTEFNVSSEAADKLAKIAKSNGIDYEDLNVKVDEDGFVTFLGHAYSDMVINDEDDALLSLEEISDLIGLDGVSLEYYRSDISPISGNTYYTFYQVEETQIQGHTAPVRFYNNLIKVSADENGKLAAVSTYINHDETEKITSEDILTTDEINTYVQTIVDDPDSVITDATKLVYWDDEDTVSGITSGKRVLAYLVYIKGNEEVVAPTEDDEEEEQEDSKQVTQDEAVLEQPEIGTRFEVAVLSAIKDYVDEDNYNIDYITTFNTNSLDQFDDGEYTSLYSFEGMSDAGEYTYTLSTDWIKESYSEFEGSDTIEVTVPIAYDKASGLYYLADVNRHIMMDNYYDLDNIGWNKEDLNPIVSKTPEDISSWGFLREGDADNGIEEFLFDPDYVFAVYENTITIYDMFNTRYGFDGVDTTGMPILCTVYNYPDEYPEEVMDFTYNASCAGQLGDWELIITSPRLAACISPTVMGHEFTHGVNQQLTSSQYFNQPGAMMESYADIIGEELAILYGNDELHTPWHLGGDYCELLRSMGDPYVVNNPKYMYGANYIPEATYDFGDCLDNGGVHTNSGVTNYIAYRLTHEEDASLLEGEQILDIGTNLDMWFETMYLATYLTDFADMGHFLEYTKNLAGLNDGQKKLVGRVLKEHGMLGDCKEYRELLASENAAKIKYTFDVDKEDFFDRNRLCIIASDVLDADGNSARGVGKQITEAGTITMLQTKILDNQPLIIVKGEDEAMSATYMVTGMHSVEEDDFIFHIKEVTLTKADKFTLPDNEEITQSSFSANEAVKYLTLDKVTSFREYGRYLIATRNKDNDNSAEFNLYIIDIVKSNTEDM